VRIPVQVGHLFRWGVGHQFRWEVGHRSGGMWVHLAGLTGMVASVAGMVAQ